MELPLIQANRKQWQLMVIAPLALLISTAMAQECSATSLCATGCCSEFGFCGTGDDHCGKNCLSTCDYKLGCDVNNPCPSGKGCCSKFGFCGLGPVYCALEVCVANCDQKSECDPGYGAFGYSEIEECLLNVCCSKWGFCGLTEEFCGNKTMTRPSYSSSGSTTRRTIGYYEGWANRKVCQRFTLDMIPLGTYTHINFAFASIDSITFSIVPGDPSDIELYKEVTMHKLLQPDLQVFIVIGGWTFSDAGLTATTFSDLAASLENQKKFFTSLTSFMSTYSFDGVEIDWDHLTPMGSGGVSNTLPASYWYLQYFDLEKLQKSVDFFNIMTYDMHEIWDKNSRWAGNFLNDFARSQCLGGIMVWALSQDSAELNSSKAIAIAKNSSSRTSYSIKSFKSPTEVADQPSTTLITNVPYRQCRCSDCGSGCESLGDNFPPIKRAIGQGDGKSGNPLGEDIQDSSYCGSTSLLHMNQGYVEVGSISNFCNTRKKGGYELYSQNFNGCPTDNYNVRVADSIKGSGGTYCGFEPVPFRLQDAPLAYQSRIYCSSTGTGNGSWAECNVYKNYGPTPPGRSSGWCQSGCPIGQIRVAMINALLKKYQDAANDFVASYKEECPAFLASNANGDGLDFSSSVFNLESRSTKGFSSVETMVLLLYRLLNDPIDGNNMLRVQHELSDRGFRRISKLLQAEQVPCNAEKLNSMIGAASTNGSGLLTEECAILTIPCLDPDFFCIDPNSKYDHAASQTSGSPIDSCEPSRNNPNFPGNDKTLHQLRKRDGFPREYSINIGTDVHGDPRLIFIWSFSYQSGQNSQTFVQITHNVDIYSLNNPEDCTDASYAPTADPEDTPAWVIEHIFELQTPSRLLEFMVHGILPEVITGGVTIPEYRTPRALMDPDVLAVMSYFRQPAIDKSLRSIVTDMHEMFKFSRITFICSKTDDISVLEASDSLGLEDVMTEDYTKIDQIDKQVDKLNAKIAGLKESMAVYNDIYHDADESLDIWDDLRRDLDADEVSDNEAEVEEEDLDRGETITIEDIEQKIDELKDTKKKARKEKVAIELATKDVKNESKGFGAERKEVDTRMKDICIDGRNNYSKTAIQQDSATGIKEHDMENAEEEGAKNFNLDEDIRDYDAVARSLPVFCVSSRAYQQLNGRLKKNAKIPGFRNVQETETVESRSRKNGSGIAGLSMLSQQLRTYEATFSILTTEMVEAINNLQCDANRKFVPVIARSLAPSYQYCASERAGMYMRMEDHMRASIDQKRNSMFKESCDEVKKSLDKMFRRVEESMNNKTDEVYLLMRRDYLQVLNGAQVGGEVMSKWERHVRLQVARALETYEKDEAEKVLSSVKDEEFEETGSLKEDEAMKDVKSEELGVEKGDGLIEDSTAQNDEFNVGAERDDAAEELAVKTERSADTQTSNDEESEKHQEAPEIESSKMDVDAPSAGISSGILPPAEITPTEAVFTEATSTETSVLPSA
ncbi:hypothetical protein BOTNAR_0319g00080 [Botryotinia narcissicola]|uniref:chitinase n=1 Tax=Botryotinia narcissicola TaxID=278944 RepID=A0A4Z1HTW2_9HELO|nr:hypothetical protein BOTNAR_0319g00080 [Botryotinia narcissicola]